VTTEDLQGALMMVLLVWTVALIAWTEVLSHRSKRIEWHIDQEVRRRLPRRRNPRPQPSNVQVRAGHPAYRVADEAEQWLRDRSR
jgi:hypothetical protein